MQAEATWVHFLMQKQCTFIQDYVNKLNYFQITVVHHFIANLTLIFEFT